MFNHLSFHQESYVRQIVPSQCLAQPMAMPLAVARSWGEQAVSNEQETCDCGISQTMFKQTRHLFCSVHLLPLLGLFPSSGDAGMLLDFVLSNKCSHFPYLFYRSISAWFPSSSASLSWCWCIYNSVHGCMKRYVRRLSVQLYILKL